METREKISESVSLWYEERRMLRQYKVKDLLNEYRFKSKALAWINENSDDLTERLDSILTQREVNSKQYIEIPSEYIEAIAQDDLDPLKLLLIKETVEEMERKQRPIGAN